MGDRFTIGERNAAHEQGCQSSASVLEIDMGVIPRNDPLVFELLDSTANRSWRNTDSLRDFRGRATS